jgi:hypothetical protein
MLLVFFAGVACGVVLGALGVFVFFALVVTGDR